MGYNKSLSANNLLDGINLTLNQQYIAPSDGYLEVHGAYHTSSRATAKIYGADGKNYIEVVASNSAIPACIKRGMIIVPTSLTDDGWVHFYPFSA